MVLDPNLPMTDSDQCMSCEHFMGPTEGGLMCLAYIFGITDEILTGKVDHRQPYEGDHGVQWQEAANWQQYLKDAEAIIRENKE